MGRGQFEKSTPHLRPTYPPPPPHTSPQQNFFGFISKFSGRDAISIRHTSCVLTLYDSEEDSSSAAEKLRATVCTASRLAAGKEKLIMNFIDTYSENPPCKDCAKRSATCHGECVPFKQWKKKQNEYRKKKRKEREGSY